MADINVGSVTAAGRARLHVGDVHNNVTNKNYQYTLRTRHSDDTLHEDQRNVTLLRAAAEGQTPRVRHLIRLGADVDHADRHGLTALHYAAYSGFDDTARALIALGADVNAQSVQCGTSLCLAVLNSRRTMVEILLAARADVHVTSAILGTALHIACLAGDGDILKMLLVLGAQPKVASLADFDLFDRALSCTLHELATLTVSGPMTCSPLHIVSKSGHLRHARMLVEYGADVNAVDGPGISAIVYALRAQHFDVAQFLMSSGALPTRTRLLRSRFATEGNEGFESEMLQPGTSRGYTYGILLHAANLSDLPHVYWKYYSPGTYESVGGSGRARERSLLDHENLRAGMKQALRDGIDCLWEETWCVSDDDSVEDIIENSYLGHVRLQHAEYCYVYLSDVRDGKDIDGFDKSAWFFRPRTVAYLLAPRRMEFFARNWDSIGTRESLDSHIAGIRCINKAYLSGTHPVNAASVATKFSWFAGTLEDKLGCFAYAVMGLFGVVIHIRDDTSADAKDSAWMRLQAAIFRQTNDYSVFAWKATEGDDISLPLLADDPTRFAGCGDVVACLRSSLQPPAVVDDARLVATLAVRQHGWGRNRLVAVLDCHQETHEDLRLGIFVGWSLYSDASSKRCLKRVNCSKIVHVREKDFTRLRRVSVDLLAKCIEISE